MRFTSVTVSIFVLFTFLFVSSCIKEDGYEPLPTAQTLEVGDMIPVFEVQDGAGKKLTNKDFLGKRSYLMFFTTTCGDCRRELPRIDDVCKAVQHLPDYQVFAIARQQGKKETDEYWKDEEFTMPKFIDPDRIVYNQFAEQYVPRLYLIDAEGRIEWIQVEHFNISDEELLERLLALP